MEKTLKELIAEMDRIEEADPTPSNNLVGQPTPSNNLVGAGAMVEMRLTELIKAVRRELTDAQVRTLVRQAGDIIFNGTGDTINNPN